MAKIDCMGDGVYRISNVVAGSPVNFLQFLIDDEKPALIHTGTYPMYADVRKAIAEVLDPKRLAHVIVPHFESDECGGMGRFVAEAPKAVLACSSAGAVLNLSGWDYSGPFEGKNDGDVLDLGRHKLRFLETPHVHHWDSMMVFDEATKSLFSSDLFIQPGDQPSVVRENLSGEMCGLYSEVGIFAHEDPVRAVVNRIERLNPDWVHPMHGGSLSKDVLPKYFEALRTQKFSFCGKLFGRTLPA